MDSTDRPYKYEPLPKPICRYLTAFEPGRPVKIEIEVPKTTYIRLATLEPATQPQDDLVISLDIVPFNAPLSDSDYDDSILTIWNDVLAVRGDDPPPPKYEALSYAWGSEPESAHVRVRSRSHEDQPDSYYLSITRNLRDALRSLRKYHPVAKDPEGALASSLARVLWIDAICIDQANAAEKGPQVAMMGSIYQSASRVVAWLGPADATSHHAMRFMCDVGLQVDVDPRGSELKPAPGAADPTLGNIRVPLFDAQDHHMIRYLTALFERAWFSRLWVRQEILLGNPSRSIVLCGPRDAVPWSIFRKAIAAVGWKRVYWPRSQHQSDLMRRLFTFVTMQDETAYLSRLRLDFGALACKDPRDRIYAVLNLLGPLERRQLRIRPDYGRPFAEVYREVVRQTIGKMGDLTILEECEGGAEGDRSLPSWVPDWACQSTSCMPKAGASFASAQLAGWTASNDILVDSSDILTLTGVRVSTIQHLETNCPVGIDSTDRARVVQMLLQEELWEHDRPWNVPLREWVLTLLTGEVADAMSPPPQWAPTMEEGIETLQAILAGVTNTQFKKTFDEAKWASSISDKFLTKVAERVAGRRMCKDSRGSLVLAPSLVRPGDVVCVLLGSHNHVLLRPISPTSSQFRLVGTCFAHCALYGTALLGPVPPGIRIVCNPRTSNMNFISKETGKRSLVDPRLSPLFSKERLAELERALSETVDSPMTLQDQIDPEVLRTYGTGLDGKKGLEMRKFDII